MPDLSSYDMMNAAEKLQFEYDAGLFSNDANGNPLSGSIRQSKGTVTTTTNAKSSAV